MSKIQKLELTWVGKNEQEEIEPRILVENPELSHIYETAANGQVKMINDDGTFDNMLIHGDNLLALKALEQDFAGQVKCIYIDPPYNSGNAFGKFYDDNLEHSQWLKLIQPRIQLLRNLLSIDGVMFISIDDDERDYLKVLCDEIFGRKNFIGSLVWEKKKKPSFLSAIGVVTEYVLIYAKDKTLVEALVYGETTAGKKYPINNAGNGLKDITFPAGSVIFRMGDQIVRKQNMSEGNIKTELLNDFEIVDGRNANEFTLRGEWRYSQEKINSILESGDEIIISKIPFRPNHIKKGGEPKKMKNLLSIAYYNMATNEDATEEGRKLFGVSDAFAYPKPEMLIQTLLESITSEGDIVLDSFLGSGTTAAVAHKMKRKWIGVEMGDHAYTHCKVRLDKVISGEDQGGISKSINWQGGGSYRFYELAPSLVIKDSHGREIINPEYNANMLAAAMAKHEGFKYSPDKENVYKQGFASEKSFIFTTTTHLTAEYLDEIAGHFADDEFLVINCKSFDGNISNNYKNIKIKKIPQSILGKCVFGKDNYNLNIINLPTEEDTDEEN